MEEIEKIIKESFSINELCIKLYGYSNGSSIKKVLKLIENFDTSHFSRGKNREKYKRIEKNCPICNSIFITSIGSRDEKTTCSQKCANHYFQHGQNNPNFDREKYEEKYEKIIISLKNTSRSSKHKEPKFCKTCGIDITYKPKSRIFCSNECRGKHPRSKETIEKIKKSVKLRIENGLHKGWTSRNIISYPEKFFRKVLENNQIEFEINKPIKKRDLGIDCDSNYFLDFYIKNGKIDLEIDGKQHKYRKEHDDKRDKSLIDNGYNVYRINWKGINTKNGQKYIENEINKFLEYYKKNNKKDE